MFSVHCHPEVDGSGVNNLVVRYHLDFEEPDSGRYTDLGTIDDQDSFCGRYSLANPQYIFKANTHLRAVETARYKYVSTSNPHSV